MQVDFGLFDFGRLELHSSAGNQIAYSGSEIPSGTLTFNSPSSFTQFDLLAYSNNGQRTLLAIDNLSLVPVPEPGSAWLLLAGLGIYPARKWLARG